MLTGTFGIGLSMVHQIGQEKSEVPAVNQRYLKTGLRQFNEWYIVG
jgi:hypothetical protein